MRAPAAELSRTLRLCSGRIARNGAGRSGAGHPAAPSARAVARALPPDASASGRAGLQPRVGRSHPTGIYGRGGAVDLVGSAADERSADGLWSGSVLVEVDDQVDVTRGVAEGGEHGGRLGSVLRAVIDEVGHRLPEDALVAPAFG